LVAVDLDDNTGGRAHVAVDEDEEIFWLGNCDQCGSHYEVIESTLREVYAQELAGRDLAADKEMLANCGDCGDSMILTRQIVRVVPFSHWAVLPAASGCPECGREHELELPHDLHSLTYQYRFRSLEVQAGREERWPTWWDAMRHCSQDTRTRWVSALKDHGVELEPET
jgi:hypothetical protein